jgi:SET family sugar efflux transporter-like MFS transporter
LILPSLPNLTFMQRILVPARTFLRHRELWFALGCTTLLGLAFAFVAPFMSMFGTLEVRMSPFTFGAFMTATALSATIVSTVLARWSDTHLSRRTLLILGSICGALGYIGYAYVRDVVWLTVIGSTLIAVQSVSFSQLFAHARELLPRCSIPASETPLYMNVFRLFFALSWTVGPAVASWIIVLYSYRGIFLAAALVQLLFAVAVCGLPAAPQAGSARKAEQVPLLTALRQPALLVYFGGFVLIFAAGTIGMMNLPLFVLGTLGGTTRNVGIIYSVAPVFELPFMFYFGLLASKGDQARIIRLGVCIAFLYYGAFALVQAPWHIYLLQALGAAATAVNSGVAITFFQNYLPGQAGTATNLYANASRIGSTSGYLLFGLFSSGLNQRSVFLVCTILCGIALGGFFLIRNRRAGNEEAPAVLETVGSQGP